MEIICINNKFTQDVLEFYAKYGVRIPEENKIYSLRSKQRHSNGLIGVTLEEIINPKVPIESSLLPDAKIEPTFNSKRFTDLFGNPIEKVETTFEDKFETMFEPKINEFYGQK